jgi:hypothetical protein
MKTEKILTQGGWKDAWKVTKHNTRAEVLQKVQKAREKVSSASKAATAAVLKAGQAVKTAASHVAIGYKAERANRAVKLASKAASLAQKKLVAARTAEKATRAIAKARLGAMKASKALRTAAAAQSATAAKVAAAGSSRSLVVGQKLGRAANAVSNGFSKVMKVAGPIGTAVAVVQAGKIVAESIKDHHDFKEKLKRGEYDEKLANRLKYATTDALLGRGTTEDLVNACSGKGSFGKSSKSCAKAAGKMVQALGGAVKGGVKALAKGTGNCLKATYSKEHQCSLKHAPKAIVEGAKKLGTAVGDWFSTQYNHHKKRIADNKARKEKCKKQPKACAAEEKLWKENEARARAAYEKKKAAEKLAKKKKHEAEERKEAAAKKAKRAAAEKKRAAARAATAKRVKEAAKAGVKAVVNMHKAGKALVTNVAKKLCFWCDDEDKKEKKELAANKNLQRKKKLAADLKKKKKQKKEKEEAAAKKAKEEEEEEKEEKVSCVSSGVPGLCQLDSTCTTGKIVSGLCPGAANIRCCLQK